MVSIIALIFISLMIEHVNHHLLTWHLYISLDKPGFKSSTREKSKLFDFYFSTVRFIYIISTEIILDMHIMNIYFHM